MYVDTQTPQPYGLGEYFISKLLVLTGSGVLVPLNDSVSLTIPLIILLVLLRLKYLENMK